MREAKQVEKNNNDLMPGQAHFLGWEKSESFDKAEQMLEDYLLFGRLVSSAVPHCSFVKEWKPLGAVFPPGPEH